MNRREQITLSPEEQRAYLAEAKTIILCSIDHNGFPHPVPMWFAAQADGTILMTTFRKSQKIVNVRRNPKVTLLVESGVVYEQLKGLMLRGTAEVIDDTDRCVEVLRQVHQKMGGALQPGLDEAMRATARKRVVVKVTPERISSWDHRKLGGAY